MSRTIETRLEGTAGSLFWREFFTNSAHFPLANIFLELLLNNPFDYLVEPDPYLILLAAALQAWMISRWYFRGRPHPLPGNLIGPLIYTLFELILEGPGAIASPNHIAYWCFAFAIGTTQQLHQSLPQRFATSLLLLENVIRASILLVMYGLLEFMKDDYVSLAEFLQDPPHLFVTITIPFIGLMTGLASSNAERFLLLLKETATQLKEYSEWLLGKELLAQAVSDPRVLSLRRHDRCMLFMDIRGFTAWSEGQEPEQVVALMNAYYEAAEPVWHAKQAIKVKFTADEIMLVFATVDEAIAAAQALRDAVTPLLQPQGLSVGIGVHCGPVVEGIMGAPNHKGYDLLGDSVNTAKRLCDNALGGEILLSQEVAQWMPELPPESEWRTLQVKGKQEPLRVTILR